MRQRHMSKTFNSEFLTPLSDNLKMLHLYANPIRIGYPVTYVWAIHQYRRQYKTKEFEPFLCQYHKNNICDIRLVPLDHVTIIESQYRDYTERQLYFVSSRERPWRQRVFRIKTRVIARATCVFSQAFKKDTGIDA